MVSGSEGSSGSEGNFDSTVPGPTKPWDVGSHRVCNFGKSKEASRSDKLLFLWCIGNYGTDRENSEMASPVTRALVMANLLHIAKPYLLLAGREGMDPYTTHARPLYEPLPYRRIIRRSYSFLIEGLPGLKEAVLDPNHNSHESPY